MFFMMIFYELQNVNLGNIVQKNIKFCSILPKKYVKRYV